MRLRLSTRLGIVPLLLSVSLTPLWGQFGDTTQQFAHFAIGGGAQTFFTVHNPGTQTTAVRLDLYASDGGLFLTDQVEVAAGATQTVSYGGAAGQVAAGWADLTAPAPFSGSLFFKINQIGNVGVAPADATKTLKLFAFVGGGTRTGFAIANPSSTQPSDVTVRIYNTTGQFIGQVQFTLPVRGHKSVFLDEAPYNLTESGSVQVTATQPVIAVTLRIDNSLMASVPVIEPAAATGVPGYEQTYQTDNFSGLAGCHWSQFSCPAGKVVISGSAYLSSMADTDRPLVQVDDYPSSQTAWTAQVCNYNGHAVQGEVAMSLVCATGP